MGKLDPSTKYNSIITNDTFPLNLRSDTAAAQNVALIKLPTSESHKEEAKKDSLFAKLGKAMEKKTKQYKDFFNEPEETK